MITITDIRNVSVNGSNVGALVNAFQESKDPVAVQIALEGYCDGLIATHAEAVKVIESTHAEAITALTAERDQLAAFQASFETTFKHALKDNDLATYEAAAKDFVQPAADRLKAEKLAKAKALRDEAKQLEDEAK